MDRWAKYIDLFAGINTAELDAMLACLGVRNERYGKREVIIFPDDNADRVGVVIRGGVLIIKEDFFGNRSIVDHIGQYDMFGEAFACAGVQKSPVMVLAAEDTEIMWLQFSRIVNTCSSNCIFHSRLIQNMLKLLAQKNLKMNQKLEITSKRSIREKLLTYLVIQADAAQSPDFVIPLSRSELADYLYVDRSAMSRELCKMRDEGLIDFHKSHFTIRQA